MNLVTSEHLPRIPRVWIGRSRHIVVYGAIGNASIRADGNSVTSLMTVNGSVTVDLDEVAIVEIVPAKGRLR